ncbi:MAG TPA: hypothetical protein VIL32_11840 [Steroidobacteraceae bacterium]
MGLGRRACARVALAIVLSVLVPGPALARNSVTLEHLAVLAPRSATLSLSSTGRYLALSVSGELVIIDTRTGISIENLGQGALPVWSRSGERLAFYSVRSGTLQLWCWNCSSAALTQLTHFPNGIDVEPTTRVGGWVHDAFRFSWSASDDALVFASRVEFADEAPAARANAPPAERSPIVLTERSSSRDVFRGVFLNPSAADGVAESRDGASYTFRPAPAGATLYSQLFLVSLRDGSIRQLTADRRSYFHPMWAPQGRYIAAAVVNTPGVTGETRSGDIVIIDADTSEQHVLASGAGVKYQPKWDPAATTVAYLERDTALSRPRILTQRVFPQNSAPARVCIPDRHVFDFIWSPDGEALLVSYKDGASMRLGRAAADRDHFDVISRQNAYPIEVTSFAIDPKGTLAWFQYDPRDFATVRLATQSHPASSRILKRLNPEHRNLNVGEVRSLTWKGADGRERTGTVLLPPDFDEDRVYPLIVDAYPLRSGADWTHPLSGNFAWASLGYVVLRPSGRAPHVWTNPWTDVESSASGNGPDGWAVAFDDVRRRPAG